ncbi:hypothetical protein GCM10027591_04440 [Zhihengliuella somnathii]
MPRPVTLRCKLALPLIATALVVTACASDTPVAHQGEARLQSAPAVTMQDSTAGSSARQESVASSNLSPVYWLGTVDGEPRLYREFVHGHDHGDPIATSLHYMLAEKPFDPDYSSVWKTTDDIGTSVSAENVITVDIGQEAFAKDLSPAGAEAAVQQLVYTATASAWSAGLLSEGAQPRVRLLIDGRSNVPAFGHVNLNRPMPRLPRFQAPVWIISPQHGSERAAGGFEVSGVAEEYPGGLRWSLKSVDDGSADRSGAVEDQTENGLYSIPLELTEGTYEVFVWGLDESGNRQAEDSKTFTVASGSN